MTLRQNAPGWAQRIDRARPFSGGPKDDFSELWGLRPESKAVPIQRGVVHNTEFERDGVRLNGHITARCRTQAGRGGPRHALAPAHSGKRHAGPKLVSGSGFAHSAHAKSVRPALRSDRSTTSPLDGVA